MESRDSQLSGVDGPSFASRHSLVSAQSSLSLVLSNLLLVALFALMMWSAVPRDELLAWLLVSFVVGAVDVIVRIVVARGPAADSPMYRRVLIAIDVSIGLIWVYAAVVFFPILESNLRFFCLFALGAPALCTAVYQHADLPASSARIGLALPLAAMHLISGDDSLGNLQALIILGFWTSLIWLALRLHRSLQHRLTLIESRDALLKKVADNARDLEVLRSAERESRELAESANLAKSRFLAHSSHDLRQPLHAISLLLETVDDERLDESTGYVIGRVRQSVEFLAKLFDSLLDLTLLDTGQVDVRRTTFGVDDLFQELAADFSTVAEANNVTINVEANGIHIDSDPTIARRMIQNLLANAIRHSEGGEVALQSRCVNDSVFLDVRDTGGGIAPSDQKRIFEEFTKLDGPRINESIGGLGLGLAIVNRLARLNGVKVTVESEPSRGSLFSIGPFDLGSAETSKAATQQTSLLDLRGVNIIVVDDDIDTLNATGKLLSKWGLIVTLLETGDVTAMPIPEILVCDYELGTDDTGIDVVRNAREQFGGEIPSLLISGNTSPELSTLALAERLRLLHKPVRPAQLKSALLTLLGTSVGDEAAAVGGYD